VSGSVAITAVSPAKTAEPIEMRSGGADSRINHVLDAVHMGANWRIRLSDLCSATMQAFVYRRLVLVSVVQYADARI